MKSAGDVSIGILGYTFGLVLGALVCIKAGNRYPGNNSGRPSESPWVCWICFCMCSLILPKCGYLARAG